MRMVGISGLVVSVLFSLVSVAQTPAVSAVTPATQAAAGIADTKPPQEIKLVEINSAARVVFVEGPVSIVGSNDQRRAAKVGDTIFEGDSLVTGKDGELHMDMEDGGYIAVRPNTRMRITKYQARGDANDTSVIGLLQGSFRAVSGWIGKFNQPKYVVKTPNATIGLRGTDHEPLVIPKGTADAEGEPGTYDKVNIGGSTIRTAQGTADVVPGQAGFVGHDAKAPRILKDTPRFFRATRNEKLLDGKHGLVQQRILERRDARRAEVKSRLENAGRMAAERRAEFVANQKKQREERQTKIQQQRQQGLKAREAQTQKAAETQAEKKQPAVNKAAGADNNTKTEKNNNPRPNTDK